MRSQFDLNKPILEFTNSEEKTCITLKDTFSSILILGATGSGKSSGSAATIIRNLLSNGCGGLILSVKNEYDTILRYCQQTGREQHLIRVSIDGEHAFDFLEYVSTRSQSNFVSNIVNLLYAAIEAGSKNDSGQIGGEMFWNQSLRMLMTHTISLSMLAYGRVTVSMLYDIALSITNADKDSFFEKTLNTAKDSIQAKIDEWEAGKEDWINTADDLAYNEALFKAIPQAREFKIADQYFHSFRNLNPKTRTIVESIFSGFLFNLIQEPVYSLFSNCSSTFSPESCFDGKIILLDLPIKIYGQAARYAQLIFKMIWQAAMERRNLKENNRPVFLFSDECQELLTENDNMFTATSRSSNLCNIWVTQSLPNLYACIGGNNSEHFVKGLIANFATKIIHANTDVETNSWASNLIGEAYQKDESETISTTNGTMTTSQTVTVKLAKMVRPEAFNSLLTGGVQNGYRVTAYLHCMGKKFANGFNHKLVAFNQHYKTSI